MTELQKNKRSRSRKNDMGSRDLSGNSVDTTMVPQNNEQRRMVSEAAYFRAMSRNFAGGDPVGDWLEAEREVATQLSACTPSAEVGHNHS